MPISTGSGRLKYAAGNFGKSNQSAAAVAASAGGSASRGGLQHALGSKRIKYDYAMQGRRLRHEAQQRYYDREHSKGAQLEGQRHQVGMQDDRQDFLGDQNRLNRNQQVQERNLKRQLQDDEQRHDVDEQNRALVLASIPRENGVLKPNADQIQHLPSGTRFIDPTSGDVRVVP